MLKRMLVVAVAMGVLGGLLVGPALSDGPPPHAHLLVTGLEVDADEWPLSWKKCRPLANGQPVPTNAHHANLHTGRAGEAQWEAGNAVVPAGSFTPWSNCEELSAFFFGE